MGISSNSLSLELKRRAGIAPAAKARKNRGEGATSIAKANRLARLPDVLKLLGTEKLPAGVRVKATRGTPNTLERDFDGMLASLMRCHEISAYDYEPISLRVGAAISYYTPDFVVRYLTGDIVIYETKGYRHSAGIRAVKSAALLFPQWKFFIVSRNECGWKFEELSPEPKPCL